MYSSLWAQNTCISSLDHMKTPHEVLCIHGWKADHLAHGMKEILHSVRFFVTRPDRYFPLY